MVGRLAVLLGEWLVRPCCPSPVFWALASYFFLLGLVGLGFFLFLVWFVGLAVLRFDVVGVPF